MSNARKGLVAAMEQEALIENADATTVIPDNAGSLETDMLDIAEIEATLDEAEAGVDEVVEVVEALEDIAVAMEACVENGGMDKHSAHMVGIALDRFYSRAGLRNIKAMPALESFNGQGTRVGASQLALEDLREQIAQVWEKIIAAVEKAVEWVKAYFAKIYDAAGKVQERANGLAARADKVEGKSAYTHFENERVAKALAINGTVPSNIKPNVTEFAAFAKQIFESESAFHQLADELIEFAGKPDALKNVAEFTLDMPATKIGSLIVNPTQVGLAEAAPGLAIYRSEEFFGGKGLVSYAPKGTLKGEEGIAALAGLSSAVAAFKNKPVSPDLAVLSPSDAQAVAEAVAAIAVSLGAFRSQTDAANVTKGKFLAIAKKAAADGKTAADEDKAAYAALQKIGQCFARIADQPGASVAGYVLGTCKALLDYVELSLKAHDKAAEGGV